MTLLIDVSRSFLNFWSFVTDCSGFISGLFDIQVSFVFYVCFTGLNFGSLELYIKKSMAKKKNPQVYMDVCIDGDPAETMVFEVPCCFGSLACIFFLDKAKVLNI